MTRHMIRTAAASIVATLFLAGGEALANDSTASLQTGDLVLVPNADIRMLEEDLYLSTDEIRVRYLFRNTGAQPITTLVAFPLPPIEYSEEASYDFVPGDPYDVVDFQLWIDGAPIGPQLDAKAIGKTGTDVTALLARWQIPVTMVTPDQASADRLYAHLDNLPSQALAELRQAGAIHDDDWGDGFWPAWQTHLTYFWKMTFPQGQDVEVHHAYTPVPTWTFFSDYDIEARSFHREACIDPSFESGARRMLAASEHDILSLKLLDYILTTANNWRGPIGRFHLTIDKGSPAALVSLCRDGIRKTGPTTFEWSAENYTPDHDLTVLFISQMPES